ncbi:MAG: imidazoleglycerol-phosphate dehydratase HisB [Candidatus Methanomethylicia archaeon]
MRMYEFSRKTLETEVYVKVNIDGSGESLIDSSITFLNHMLKTFSLFSSFDLIVRAKGDLRHHIIEDVAICLGKAIDNALGDREDIERFGYSIIPMDCSLALVSLDLARRPYAVVNLNCVHERIDDISVQEIKHFLRSFAYSANITLHVNVLYGEDDHHKVEAVFKALGLAFKNAIYPSKGCKSVKGIV